MEYEKFSTNCNFETEVKGHGGACQEFFPHVSDMIMHCAVYYPGIFKLHYPVLLNQEINDLSRILVVLLISSCTCNCLTVSIWSTQTVAAPFHPFNLHTDKLAFLKFLTGYLKWPSGTSVFFFYYYNYYCPHSVWNKWIAKGLQSPGLQSVSASLSLSSLITIFASLLCPYLQVFLVTLIRFSPIQCCCINPWGKIVWSVALQRKSHKN